ncbi:MAG: taurine catabolism dioxygenase TauD [Acidobacteria bacterium]|nr:MAG: taurine catabolism dioxygenase TauD [Acidobacteriota bacterium]PYS83265.1 MAG: taurine catabolism dioxygenase TauD [Acidobacteriota bacterium]
MGEEHEADTRGIGRPGALKRRPVDVSAQELVKAEPLSGAGDFPLLVQPLEKRLSPVAWAEDNRQFVKDNLVRYGAILFRGFNLPRMETFEQFVRALFGELLPYEERSSPRHRVGPNIYTSTDYPADQSIFLHNENSYQNRWPLKIFFYCLTPAHSGGETPIADCRKVGARIAPEIRERFIEKKVMYVRNFGDGFGLSLEEAFQTTEREAIEEHCRRADIGVEWKGGNRLRTRAVRPAVAKHPLTGELVWFNHAVFFHVSTLEPSVREALLAEFGEDDLPANTYYGDGTRIEPSVLDRLREIYRQEAVAFPWAKGDLLILDNMLAAHGRAPFTGPRQILVGMSQPCSRSF